MKGLTPQRGILAGVLLIAIGVLVADRLSGNRQPAAVQAGEAQPAELGGTNWEPVGDLVGRLTQTGYAPVGEELDRLERDVFLPTPIIEAAVAPTATAPLVPATESSDDPNVASDARFAARHKLAGVMLAGRPLAVVNDRVLTLKSDLDGYTLIDVQRDYVVFQQISTGVRVTLELDPGPKKH